MTLATPTAAPATAKMFTRATRANTVPPPSPSFALVSPLLAETPAETLVVTLVATLAGTPDLAPTMPCLVTRTAALNRLLGVTATNPGCKTTATNLATGAAALGVALAVALELVLTLLFLGTRTVALSKLGGVTVVNPGCKTTVTGLAVVARLRRLRSTVRVLCS